MIMEHYKQKSGRININSLTIRIQMGGLGAIFKISQQCRQGVQQMPTYS